MCKGIAVGGPLVGIPPMPEDDLDWLEAMLTDDDDFGFVPAPPAEHSECSSHEAQSGVDLLDWFSKQLNSDTMVAPNGAVLPTAPLAAGVPPSDMLMPAAAAALACEPQLLAAPPVAMAPSNSFSSCCQAPPTVLLPAPADFVTPAQLQQMQCLLAQQQEQEDQGQSRDHQQQQRVVVVKRHRPASSSRPAAQQAAELSEGDRTERIKQKRRESAQRSRARKNAYVKELEDENAALKQQVLQLKSLVTQLQTLMAT